MTDDSNKSLALRESSMALRYEPASWPELWERARLFAAATGTRPEEAAIKALVGAELGLTTTQAWLGVHSFSGKFTVDASTLRAMVLRSGKAAVFRLAVSTAEECVWLAQRTDDGSTEPAEFRWTMQMARDAGLTGKGPWKQYPHRMLLARASADAARTVFPDVCAGLYASEEFQGAEQATPAPRVTSKPAPRPAPVSSAVAVVRAAQAVAEPQAEPEPQPVLEAIVEPEPEDAPGMTGEQGVAELRRMVAEAGADLGEDHARDVVARWVSGPRKIRRSDRPDVVADKVAEARAALDQALDGLASVEADAARVAGEAVS